MPLKPYLLGYKTIKMDNGETYYTIALIPVGEPDQEQMIAAIQTELVDADGGPNGPSFRKLMELLAEQLRKLSNIQFPGLEARVELLPGRAKSDPRNN